MKAKTVFEALKSLQGEWQGKDQEGRNWSVTYRLIANGHALVETWSPGAKNEAMTIYMLEGEKLHATHICPWGNSSQLEWVESSQEKGFRFVSYGGINIDAKDKYHQGQFHIKVTSSEAFSRSETYVANGEKDVASQLKKQGEVIPYQRLNQK